MLTEQQIIDSQADELARDYFSVFKPKTTRTLSQWADEERYVAKGTSSEPGKWKTSRVEYMREIMDISTSGTISELILMGGSQWGKTEFILNLMAFFISEDPSPILFINPKKESAEEFSEERFTPMIKATPCLSKKIEPNKSRDSRNTITNKSFKNDAHVAFVGSNVPNDVASRSRRIIVGDEIDRWAVSAGKDGDVATLARQRIKNWWNSFIAWVSTPVDFETSIIFRHWLGSDQRHRYYTCPDCGHAHHLEWENVKWEGDDKHSSPETAYYQCPECPSKWNDVTRWKLDKTGEWKKHNPDSKIAGFHISQLYSPWVKLSTMVFEYLDSRGKPLMEKAFQNTVLGLPFEDKKGAGVEVEMLLNRREEIPKFTMPERSGLITMGVDVQGDRLEVKMVAWGLNDESWILDKYKIFGDPTGSAVWKDLEEVIKKRRYKHPLRETLFRIEATAIESGHETQRVYKFAARMQIQGHNVYAIKGVPGSGRPIWLQSKKQIKLTKLFLVGVDDAKATIYGRLATENGQGQIHFSTRLEKDYFEELIAEKIILETDKNGFEVKRWYLPSGVRNEAFDLMVYAMAAKESRDIDIESRLRNMTKPKEKIDFGKLGKSLNG